MKKQKQKRNIIIISIIICILGIVLFLNRKPKKEELQDDILFFKSFYLGDKKASNNILVGNQEIYKEYIFNVSYENAFFTDINLLDTIRKDTLVNEKIAPRNIRKICNFIGNK